MEAQLRALNRVERRGRLETIMAARSLASLTISFGLVSIPVKLHSATRHGASVPFHYIHKKCGSRLRQQYVCIKEEVVVPREEMVKGFEFAKDQYVNFTPKELKELEERGSGVVEITEFVPEKEIDPLYFDSAYYLTPDKGGGKPYALLIQAMRKTRRCAVGRWAARGKQYLVQLRPHEETLVMQQLRYADEIKPLAGFDAETGAVKEAEVRLALQLVDQIASEHFDPSAYRDEVKERIEKAIEKKVEGEDISVSPGPEAGRGAKVIDLMEALRASLGKTPAARRAAAGRRRKPPRRATAPSQRRAKAARAR
jgi:DNA end-binding protein Ku